MHPEKLRELTEGVADFTKRHAEKTHSLELEIDDLKSGMARLRAGSARQVGEYDPNAPEIKQFSAFCRSGDVRHLESKAFTAGSATGSYVVPEVIDREIQKIQYRMSPMRRLCRVIQAETGDIKVVTESNDAGGGWAGEGTTRSETDTPTLNEVTLTGGELYAVPKASNWWVSDAFFDAANFITNFAGRKFAQLEGAAVISGDGSNKPTGILDGTPVSTGDDDSPARAFGTIQYIPSGAAAGFQNDRLGSPAGNPGDAFFDALYSLHADYRSNATWLMNSSTLGAVRRFKNADGDYLFQPGLTSGADGILLGRPVVVCEDLADAGTNAFPVLIGDFRAGYTLADVGQRTIIVDQTTSRGHTLWYIAQRVYGKLVNDDAIRAIKCAVS